MTCSVKNFEPTVMLGWEEAAAGEGEEVKEIEEIEEVEEWVTHRL